MERSVSSMLIRTVGSFLVLTIVSMVPAQDIELTAVPDNVYKITDVGKQPTESWMFYVLLNDKKQRDAATIRPQEAKLELMSGPVVVQTILLPESTLLGMRRKSFTVAKDEPVHSIRRVYSRNELFDFRFEFSHVLTSWKVDRVRITLRLLLPDKKVLNVAKEISVINYQQRTALVFPLKGPAIVTQGMWNNGGHAGYGNQYALDVIGLDPNYAAMLCDSEELTAYATWGREVIAPAAGTVVYVRNDVPDNGPGSEPEKVFAALADPVGATAGNAVVIAHGNSEYSVLMHMKKGSVLVTKNQTVKRGDVIGSVGSSGDSFGPHLHFQMQTGPELFMHPSVPVTFENLKGVSLARGVYFDPK